MFQQVTNGRAGMKVLLPNWNETKAGMGGCVDAQPLESHACCIIITWLKNRPGGGRITHDKMAKVRFEKGLVRGPQAEASVLST